MENNAWGRLLSVLWAPLRTFKALAARPTWGAALGVFVGCGLLLAVVATRRLDFEAQTRAALERRGAVAEDQLAHAVELQERFGVWIAAASALIAQPLGLLLVSVVFWTAFRTLGEEFAFRSAFAVTLHSLVPGSLLGPLLSLPVLWSRPVLAAAELRRGVLASHLGFFAPEEVGPRLLTFLGSIDVFSLWSLALLAAGFQVVARVSRAAAGVTVVGLWGLYVLGKVALAGLF